MKKQLLLGLMAMSLPLTSWAQADDPLVIELAETSKAIEYAGTETKNKVEFSVYYVDGDTKQKLEGTDYEVSYSGEVKNVGEYTITVKGKGFLSRYTATETFSVTKKPVTTFLKLTSGLTTEYGTPIQLEELVSKDENTFDFLAADDKPADFLKCLTVDDSRQVSTTYPNVGHYEIGVKDNGEATNNYSYTADGGGMWVFYDITPKTLTLSVDNQPYNGQTVTVENLKAKFEVEEGDEEDVKIALSYEGEVKNANTYSLTVTPSGSKVTNYTIAEAVDFTISPLTLTLEPIEGAKLSTEYDGTTESGDVTAQFSHTGDVTGEWDGLNVTMQWTGGPNAGKYNIDVYIGGTKADENNKLVNYTIDYTLQQYEITGKVTESSKVDIAIENRTYQGKVFDVTEGGLTVTYDGEKLTENVDYTYTANAEKATDANTTFTVKVTFKANYDGEATGEFTITKADLYITPIEGVTIGKTYGDKEESKDLLGKYFTIRKGDLKGNDNAESLKLTMERSSGEAVAGIDSEKGGYCVRPHVDGKSFIASKYGEALTNYMIQYKPLDDANIFRIAKKELSYTIAAEKKYDATTNLPTEFEINSKDLVKDEELGIDDSEGNIFTTKPIITWGEDVTAAKNVGKYVVTVTEENEGVADNYNPIFTAPEEGETNYEITPRTLTITAADQSIAFGTSEEDIAAKLAGDWFKWPNNDVTNEQNAEDVTNDNRQLLTNDRMAVGKMYTFELGEGAKTGATGEYKSEGENVDGIVITWKELTDADEAILANYGGKDKVVLNHGALTIGEVTKEIVLNATNVDAEESEEGAEESEADESTWSVAKTIANYNGAKVKSVTIKNLTNNFMGDGDYVTDQKITAEKWYTLVLPFDVTVAELSRKFGYAIVNIPDTDNSTKGEVHFKLTMQEVPANTLMAFKVAYDMDWAEIENGITFRGKTIVAPTENYEWAADHADNEFRGVYAKETITEATEFFWSPKTGKPTRASAVVTQKGHGVDVYPLNGYIRLKDENAPATVRFFMEEANGSTTAINAVTGETIKNAAEGWYTVGGVKLNGAPTEKGVYINNGQKVVIK